MDLQVAYHIAFWLMSLNVALLIRNIYNNAKSQTRKGRVWKSRTYEV